MVTARDAWQRLPKDVHRDEYFRTLHEAVAEYYLADPSNPYQQSGRSSGPTRWEETRRILLKAIHRDGDFLDVGCANGLLLESLVEWAGQEGLVIRPHGVDFVEPLIDFARARFPQHRDSFHVANAFYWSPPRQYDFVRTNLEYVPPADWFRLISTSMDALTPTGRLILCHYRNADEPRVDVAAVANSAGYTVIGWTEVTGTMIAWLDKAEAA